MVINQMNTSIKLLIIAGFVLASAITALVLLPPEQGSNGKAGGKALIGGPFTLINPKGETVTDKSFRGKYMLVYFGYTFCPDVCPNELGVMSAALDKLGPLAEQITPLFISIDPSRDTPRLIGEYVENFHKNFVGLTGNKDQVKIAAKAYKVYYAKGKSDGSSDYVMDHSSIIYLMDPQGQYVSFFSYGTAPDVMAKKITKLIGKQG